MYKSELLSIIQNELKDNPNATSIEISRKYNIPVKIVEFYIKVVSKGQKKENPVPENDEAKVNEPTQDGRRNPNRKDVKERLKNPSPTIPMAQDDESDFKSENGKFETQVLAYVANIDSVSVVDILRGREITKIPAGLEPFDVAVSPDKRYVYVTNLGDATLSVISTYKNREIARVNLNEPPFTAGLPLGVAVSPDGRFIYTTNYDTSNISIVEAAKWGWEVIGVIPLLNRPEKIDITPNGRLAYVTLRDDSAIAVIDLLVNLPVKTIPAGTRPIDIAINKDYLGLAANPGSDDVTVFNAKLAESSPITIQVGDTPPGVAFNPEGNIAYVTNRSGMSVSVVDVFLHKVIKTIPVGQEPIGVAVTEGGRFTVVANAVDNTVSIIDNAILRVIYTVDVGLEPFWLKTVTVR